MSFSQDTWIARPGELIRAGQAVNELATRVGGLPVYPQGCAAPAPHLTSCGECGKQLALLLQAYAPLTDDQTDGGQAQPRRFLYVFGCVDEGCGKQPGCWRVLRLTQPSSSSNSSVESSGVRRQTSEPTTTQQQQQQPLPVPAPPAPPAPAPAASDNWGVSRAAADNWGAGSGTADDWATSSSAADDWGAGADGGAAAASAAFDFGDLNAALEAVGSAGPAPKAAKQAGAQAGSGGSRSGGGGGKQKSSSAAAAAAASAAASAAHLVYDPARASLPAFYLCAEPESQCTAGSSGNSGGQEHLADIMARYEAEAAAVSNAAAEVAPAAAAAALAAGACTPGGAGAVASGAGKAASEPESWGGEGYEEDAVLAPTGGKRAGLGAPFLKFCKQVARCPDQCARYSFGGSPLWPSAQPPAPPPPCPACAGPRRFELQLMAPLIHGLAESADWLAAEGGAPGACLQPADSWEWLTLAIYTCGRCCTGGALREEAVAVANEE